MILFLQSLSLVLLFLSPCVALNLWHNNSWPDFRRRGALPHRCGGRQCLRVQETVNIPERSVFGRQLAFFSLSLATSRNALRVKTLVSNAPFAFKQPAADAAEQPTFAPLLSLSNIRSVETKVTRLIGSHSWSAIENKASKGFSGALSNGSKNRGGGAPASLFCYLCSLGGMVLLEFLGRVLPCLTWNVI